MEKGQGATNSYNDAIVTPELVSQVSILSASLILVEYWRNNLFTSSAVLVSSIVAGITLLAITHLIARFELSKHHLLYLTMYHLLLSFILICIVNTSSFFVAMWIMVAYFSEFYYQTIGLLLSLLGLLLTLAIGAWYQQDIVTITVIGDILVTFFVLALIAIVITKVVSGITGQRFDLADKMLRAKYEHERLVALINSMNEAVIVTDEQGAISIYNAAALSVLDTNVGLENKHIANVLPLNDENGKLVDVMQLARNAKPFLHRSDLLMPNGGTENIALEININRVELSSMLAHQQGYTFIFRDITKQKSLDEERDDFISVVSHELRTPIAVVEANIAMAKRVSELNASRGSLEMRLDKAHQQVMFLAELMNDLTTLSRAERNHGSLELETFDAAKLVDEINTAYKQEAEAKGLVFRVQKETDLPPVTTSRLYLKEVLQNLITNAIKYTEKGSIKVSALKNQQGSVSFVVSDTGLGIAKHEQAKIFEKFWRSEDVMTRQTNGTGLGLYITAKLIKRLGAHLDLKSEMGVGSTFTLDLPVALKTPVTEPEVGHESQNFYQ